MPKHYVIYKWSLYTVKQQQNKQTPKCMYIECSRSFIRIILHIYFINGGVQLRASSDGRFAFSWSKSEVTRGDRTESCLIVVNDQRITTRLVNIMTEVGDAPISRKSDETLSIQLSARSSPSYENGRLRVG